MKANVEMRLENLNRFNTKNFHEYIVLAITIILGSHPLISFAGGDQDTLYVGTGQATIPVTVNSDTQGDSGTLVTFVLKDDPQQSTAIAISDGQISITYVSVDTIYLTSGSLKLVNEIIKNEKKLDTNIFLVASHGHANLSGGVERNQGKRIHSAIIESIVEAHNSLVPASVAYGSGHYFSSLNRVQRRTGGNFTTPLHTFCEPDIKCPQDPSHNPLQAMMPLEVWQQGHPNDPIDPEVSVLHFRDENKVTIGTVFNYASHPVIVRALYSSPDYPGYSRRLIERNLGGRAIFLQGFAGDIVPNHHNFLEPTAMHTEVSRFSNGLAGAVISVVKNLHNYSSDANIQTETASIDYTSPTKGKCKGGDSKVLVSASKINDHIFLTTMSGEPFVQLGLDIKQHGYEVFPNSFILVAGYTNGANAYIPPSADYGGGGYGTVPEHWACIENDTGTKAMKKIIELMNIYL